MIYRSIYICLGVGKDWVAYKGAKPCDGEFMEVECKVEDQLFIFMEWLPELALHYTFMPRMGNIYM